MFDFIKIIRHPAGRLHKRDPYDSRKAADCTGSPPSKRRSCAAAGMTLLGVCLFTAFPASAEIFQWRDPETKLSVMYPDDWRRLHGQQPDDIVTIIAPEAGEFASCRIRVNDDRRFVIYPRSHAGAIQRAQVSRDFWQDYVGAFEGATIHSVTDNTGIGNGFASMADISFVSTGGPRVQKRGIMYATLYNDKLYVAECASEYSVFPKWFKTFKAVAQSIDMRPEYATHRNGHYREFLEDPELRIHGLKPADLYVY